jgi:hypothetical protein
VVEITRLELAGPAPASGRVVVHVPYFLELADAAGGGTDATRLELPLGPGRVEFAFTRLAAAPRSWRASVDWYKGEYRRRWEERGR